MHAYIAGPMFNPGELSYLTQIDARVRKAGLTTFLNQRDGIPFTGPDDVEKIFKEDIEEVTKADVVVASLNGMDVDAGTAWELGLAYARGKYIVGVYTDLRLHFKYQTVNLMIQGKKK
jgi:nucleoside 2-deoxyribosyltransferase